MARFKYNGEQTDLGAGHTWGPCTEIRLPLTDGSKDILTPVDPATEFEIDEDIGYDITDDRSLRHLRMATDGRFTEL
jgi:hypothetical protein